MVQTEVLESVESENLAVYAVWEPMLRTDDERSSRKATILFPDERVSSYWVDSQSVGKLFQAPIGLMTEPAWDVYLVYAPGVLWTENAPPEPSFFMHQLGGRLPDDLRLDGARLAKTIEGIIRE